MEQRLRRLYLSIKNDNITKFNEIVQDYNSEEIKVNCYSILSTCIKSRSYIKFKTILDIYGNIPCNSVTTLLGELFYTDFSKKTQQNKKQIFYALCIVNKEVKLPYIVIPDKYLNILLDIPNTILELSRPYDDIVLEFYKILEQHNFNVTCFNNSKYSLLWNIINKLLHHNGIDQKSKQHWSRIYLSKFHNYDLEFYPPFFEEFYSCLTSNLYQYIVLFIQNKNKTLFDYFITKANSLLISEVLEELVVLTLSNSTHTTYYNREYMYTNSDRFLKLLKSGTSYTVSDIISMNIFDDNYIYYLSKLLSEEAINNIRLPLIKLIIKSTIIPYKFSSLLEIGLYYNYKYKIKNNHCDIKDKLTTDKQICLGCGDAYYRNPDSLIEIYKDKLIKKFSFCSTKCQLKLSFIYLE